MEPEKLIVRVHIGEVKKMSKFLAFYIFLVVIMFVFAFRSIYQLGYVNGNTQGFSDGIDADNRIECENKFRGQPLERVNTECLKYFER